MNLNLSNLQACISFLVDKGDFFLNQNIKRIIALFCDVKTSSTCPQQLPCALSTTAFCRVSQISKTILIFAVTVQATKFSSVIEGAFMDLNMANIITKVLFSCPHNWLVRINFSDLILALFSQATNSLFNYFSLSKATTNNTFTVFGKSHKGCELRITI